MRRFSRFFLSLWLALLVSPLGAGAALDTPDSDPTATQLGDGCTSYAMCVAQGTTGICDTVGNETGKPIVLRNFARGLGGQITFYAARSTATTYTCDLVSNDEGYTAASAAGDGSTIAGAQITQAARMKSVSGAPLHSLWFNCTTISGGSVTINALVCQSNR